MTEPVVGLPEVAIQPGLRDRPHETPRGHQITDAVAGGGMATPDFPLHSDRHAHPHLWCGDRLAVLTESGVSSRSLHLAPLSSSLSPPVSWLA